MIIVTKPGFRLWWSGMQAVIMAVACSLLIERLIAEELSFVLQALLMLIAYPIAIGWVQRRYWTGS